MALGKKDFSVKYADQIVTMNVAISFNVFCLSNN